MSDSRKRARARALRVARVVSIAAAIVVGPACASSHDGGDAPPLADAMPVDTGAPDSGGPDTGTDSGPPDTGLPDTGLPDTSVADASECPEPEFSGSCCEPMPQECCTFGWDEANQCCITCAIGPLAPPSVPV